MKIPILDLKSQYLKIKNEIDTSIQKVIDSAYFINGPAVQLFEKNLASYLDSKYVIGCANGTDALQIALMSLQLKPGDEVIVPAFTFAATAAVVAILNLVPIFVDVELENFNIKIDQIESVITPRTKAIIPVHLFGQGVDMEPLMKIAKRHSLFVIEDNAQALGAKYYYSNGSSKYYGTIGDIGCTSFFPTKNLGCYGDGGAIFCQDKDLAQRIKMVTDHGQKVRYSHDIIGCNSRLDSIQAAILDVKLKYLTDYSKRRSEAAALYKELLANVEEITLPSHSSWSDHLYHQFTIRTKRREKLKKFLAERGISSMIYYPYPLNRQRAFSSIARMSHSLENSEILSKEVLSLPMHSELTPQIQEIVANGVKDFFQ
ncbi:MAG: DegT/DnrJ/EryC1/StrS family aminotransferase [Bacteroidales bacterium]